MALQQLRNCNFGRRKGYATGSSGVGYTLMDVSGSASSPRTTSGVYELSPGCGIYAAYITFPNDFRGQLLWDTGTAFTTASYATEQYNVEENNPKVDDAKRAIDRVEQLTQDIWQVSFGRWHIVGNQMVFYRDDGATEIARFNLFDDAGVPTMDAVFERVKV